MGKGINFLQGGPRKVVDLTKNRGFEIVNTRKKKGQSTLNYLTGRVLKKVYYYIIKNFKFMYVFRNRLFC